VEAVVPVEVWWSFCGPAVVPMVRLCVQARKLPKPYKGEGVGGGVFKEQKTCVIPGVSFVASCVSFLLVRVNKKKSEACLLLSFVSNSASHDSICHHL
jgi:hypothetical protein